ncbi:MAG TPA: helix-turn-helix domain-containing protein [Actinophytocola sp.]|uniref:helix-turn-helix domain-containing protein n=1 Tax=Actinophytocola sp. TaxID=1872138 RepID=UPI002DDD55CB|nr:helix-turn-helix domain-containing protein [Actinophytocola sp.]HEV2782284.1 helix-turn-helix domain-containing protein [Actinophytocola sp.]
MPDDACEPSLGCLIRDLRMALGYSQGRLAERLCELSGATITREYVSRWECGKRIPSRYWLPHLATALQVPLSTLEVERVRRREFLRLAAVAPALGAPDTAAELMASIAGGDSAPLAEVQTTHSADLALARLTGTDRASLLHLARWMTDGGSDVLRVNAAGILAKTTELDMLDAVALTLARDERARERYVWAVRTRVGDSASALAAEVFNRRDSGARWCAAWLLGQDGSPAAREALIVALRHDPVRENVRAIGLTLNGVDPCT